ncbi:MAG: nitrous oxide reductase accessory protein NosL [Bacteroidota bacterium]
MKQILIYFYSFCILLIVVLLTSCADAGPEAIHFNKDACNNCKMGISDKRFACEIVSKKGKVFKFDDMACLMSYYNENKDNLNKANYYFKDFLYPHDFAKAKNLFFVKGDVVGSPMGGNIAAFSSKDSANAYMEYWRASTFAWEEIEQEQ